MDVIDNALISVHQSEDGLEVRTRHELTTGDRITLVCAVALNLAHGGELTAEQLLTAAAELVGRIRHSAGPVVAVRGAQ